MICRFCQKSPAVLLTHFNESACQACHEWIFVSNKHFGNVSNCNSLTGIYYVIRLNSGHSLTVFFDYQDEETRISERMGLSARKLIIFNVVMPVTQEFLDSVPDKIKLWQTFS
jgi:hypothetical protein